MKIELILLGVIGLVFLVDFILNSRKKPSIDNVVDQIENNEPFKQNSKFSYQFSLYKKINIVLLVLFLGLCFTPGKIIEYNENRIKKSFSDYELLANGHFIYQGIEYAFFFDNEFIDKKAITEFKKKAINSGSTLYEYIVESELDPSPPYDQSEIKPFRTKKLNERELKMKELLVQEDSLKDLFMKENRINLKTDRDYAEYFKKVELLLTEINRLHRENQKFIKTILEKTYDSISKGTYSRQNYAYTLKRVIHDASKKHRLTSLDFFNKYPKLKMLPVSSLNEAYKNLVESINVSKDSIYANDGRYNWKPLIYSLVASQNNYAINYSKEGPLNSINDFDNSLFNKIFPDTNEGEGELKDTNYTKFYIILFLVFLFPFLINQFFYDRLKYISSRKKNISLLLIIILFSKVLAHYLLYPMQENLGIHFDNLFLKELWLFIPVSLAMIFIAWYFNDKIKAR